MFWSANFRFKLKKYQKGLSLLEISLALVMLAVGSVEIGKQVIITRQRTTVAVIAGKIDVFTNAVSAYLKDNKNDIDKLDGTKISVVDLLANDYLPGDILSGYLSSDDYLYAMIKKDNATNSLEALIYNDCPPNKPNCTSEISSIAWQINNKSGKGAGYKSLDSNGNITLTGNFDSWSLDVNQWPGIDFSKASVFTLAHYSPIPSGIFFAKPVELNNFEYDVSNAGNPGNRVLIKNNTTIIDWQPIFDTDSLDFHWAESGIAYVKVQEFLVTNGTEQIIHTDAVAGTSFILTADASKFGTEEKILLTPYDENGRAGVASIVNVRFSRKSQSFWSAVTVGYHFYIINNQASGQAPVLLNSCDTDTGQAGFTSTSDLYFVINKIQFTLRYKDYAYIPPGTLFLEPQIVSFQIGSNSPVFNISTSDPSQLESINLDPFVNRFNIVPILPGIHNMSNGFFYQNINKNCTISPTVSNAFAINLSIGNVSKAITGDLTNPNLVLKDYSILLKNK